MKIFLQPKYLFFITCLFIFIYSPPFAFLPLGTIKILSLFSIVGLLFLFKSTTLKVLTNKYIFCSFLLSIATIAYAFVIDYVIYEPPALSESNVYRQALILLEVLPIALFLNLFARKFLKFTLEDILHSFAIVAFLQSLFCLIMFVRPGLKSYVMNSLLEEQAELEKILEVGFYGNLRGFGISIGYLFSLPVFQGLAICFILLICLRNFSKYSYTLLFIPLIILSIVLNARVGFITIIVLFAVALVIYFKNLKLSVISQFGLIFALVALTSYGLSTTFYESSALEKNIDWIVKSYDQNKAFIEGDGDEGTLSILLEGHLHFPQGFENNLFGEGRYIFGDNAESKSIRSDIGYIRNLYFGGYIYSLLVYSSFLILFWGALRLQKSIVLRMLMYFLLVALLVVNIKGDIFWSNPCYRAAYLVTLFPIVDRYILRQEQEKLQTKITQIKLIASGYEGHKLI